MRMSTYFDLCSFSIYSPFKSVLKNPSTELCCKGRRYFVKMNRLQGSSPFTNQRLVGWELVGGLPCKQSFSLLCAMQHKLLPRCHRSHSRWVMITGIKWITGVSSKPVFLSIFQAHYVRGLHVANQVTCAHDRCALVCHSYIFHDYNLNHVRCHDTLRSRKQPSLTS